MAGNQTAGFDAVIELSEGAVNSTLSTFFDSSGLLSSFLTSVGLGAANGAFSLDVLFDRPNDPRVPAGAADVLDLRFDVGEGGGLATLRAVAGLDTSTSAPGIDVVQVNFRDRLHFAEATPLGLPIPFLDTLFATFLRDTVGAAPVLPVPVDRANAEPTGLPVRGEGHLVDDASPADRDALAVALTFGGGAAGNPGGLANFIEGADSGAIGLFFRWLARILRPKLAEALGASEADFDVGDDFIRLNRSLSIADGEAELRSLQMQLRDGFVELTAGLFKSGFCYTATATMVGRLRLEVSGGTLTFEFEVDDPVADVDIPWECYLLGIAAGLIAGGLVGVLVGAIVGGVGGAVVGGVVGAAATGGIVGAIILGILVPTMMAILQHVLVPALEGVAGDLADRLEQNLEVPAVGLNLVFQRVFIDDIAVHFDARPVETVTVRASGLLEVLNGQFVDLDAGKVGGADLPGADLEWRGRGGGRELRTRCGATLARLGVRALAAVLRWQLYPLQYGTATVPQPELALRFPFADILGLPPSLEYRETGAAYAVRTNDGRYAVVRAREVLDDRIRLEYRTYELRLPSLEIVGGFSCESVRLPVSVKDVEALVVEPPRLAARALARGEKGAAAGADVGRWRGEIAVPTRPAGVFRAAAENFAGPLKHRWRVAGTDLAGATGEVAVAGETARYAVEGPTLRLELKSARTLEFLISVTATDEAGTTASASRCVTYHPRCKRTVAVVPSLSLYLETYRERFGVVPGPLVAAEARPEPVPEKPKGKRRSPAA